MRVDIVTIFPEAVEPFVRSALLGKAVAKGLVDVRVHDLREHTTDPRRRVDDEPYGGGPGMVMTAEPWFRAIEAIAPARKHNEPRIVLLTPQGGTFRQRRAREFADLGWIVLLCGRYEGVDERVAEHLVDEELSIGDYVLAGGEAAALVVLDAVARLIPGVVGDAESVAQDSFQDERLDYPHYTRPAELRGHAVPDVLLSGDHAAIEGWRRDESLSRTEKRRPDLLR